MAIKRERTPEELAKFREIYAEALRAATDTTGIEVKDPDISLPEFQQLDDSLSVRRAEYTPAPPSSPIKQPSNSVGTTGSFSPTSTSRTVNSRGASVPVVQNDLQSRVQALQERFPTSLSDAYKEAITTAEHVRQDAEDQYRQEMEHARGSFLEMIKENQAYQEQARKNAERKERENRARLALAGLADGLSALGNLIGTTQGAANQPQTYQMPFVKEDIDKGQARDYETTERLRRAEQALRAEEAKLSSKGNPFAVSDVAHARKLAEIAARGANSEKIQQHIDARTQQNNEARADIAQMTAESRERIAQGRNATSRANNRETNETRRIVSENRSRGSQLTTNAKMKWIHDNASGHLDELKQELIAKYGGEQNLPYQWEKNWRRYVGNGAFYNKYYRGQGWEELGGSTATVTRPVEEETETPAGGVSTKTPPSKRGNNSKTPPSKRK